MLTFLKELGIGLLCVGGSILMLPVIVAGSLVIGLAVVFVFNLFDSPAKQKMVWTRALAPA